MLSPTAAWTEAMSRADVAPRFLVKIDDGTNTHRATDGVCDALTDPVAVVSVDAVSASLDPVTRDAQVGQVSVVVLDEWARAIVSGNLLIGKKVEVLLGAESLDESDFLPYFCGAVERISPRDGAHVEIECVDAFRIAQLEQVTGAWINQHPLEIIEDILLTRAGVPSSLVDATTLDPANYTSTISHFCTSRGAGEHDTSTIVSSPSSAMSLVQEILRLINGHAIAREDGKLAFGVFDPTVAASDHWTEDDYADLAQESDDPINLAVALGARLLGSRGGLEHHSRYGLANTASQSIFAYPGTASRTFEEKIETSWCDGVALMFGSIGTADTSIVAEHSRLHAFCGLRDAKGSWPADAKLSASRPGYWLIDDEIVKVTALSLDPLRWSRHEIRDPSGTWTSDPMPSKATATVARGQLGTTAAAHSAAHIYDITMLVRFCDEIIERFSNGVKKIKLRTGLAKFPVQVGDLVTIDSTAYLDWQRDGLDSTDKWEVVGKEVRVYDDTPHVAWELAHADKTTPTRSHSAFNTPRPWWELASDRGDAGETHVASGFTIADLGGLSASIGTGRSSDFRFSTEATQGDTITLNASKETHIYHDTRGNALVYFPETIGAGAPTVPTHFAYLGAITTDASSITSIDTAARPTKAIDGGKLVDASVAATQLATNAVTAAKIASGAVTTAKIAASAVTATEIASGAITTVKVATNAITANKLGLSAFLAYRSGSNQSITAKTVTKVQFNAEDFDDGEDYDKATNYEWVAPENCKADFSAMCTLDNLTSGVYARLILYIDGSPSRYGPKCIGDGSANFAVRADFPNVKLTSGQTVDIRILHDEAPASTRNVVYNSSPDASWFSGRQTKG